MIDNSASGDPLYSELTALREQHKLYRNIVETTQEGIWFVDPRGRTIFANRRMPDLLGCTAEELYAADVFAFLDEEGRHIAKHYLADHFRGVAPEREVRFLRKDGSEVWLLLSSNPVYDDDGNYAGALAMAIEITGRKQGERVLEETRQRFAQILELANDAIISTDESQQIIMFNKGAELVFGYTADEILGRHIECLLPEAFRAKHRKQVRAFARGAAEARHMTERRPVWGRRKDGSQFPAEASISKFRQGQSTIFTAHLRDITQRQQAETALHESERMFRRLVEGSLQGIWIYSENRILFANQSLADMYRFDSPEELMAQLPVIEMIAPADRARLSDFEERRMRGEAVPSRYEFRSRRKDGTLFWMEAMVGETVWNEGAAMLATGIDITERKRAAEALQESEARLRLLTNAVPVGIAYIDAEQRYQFANATLSQWYKRPPQEMVGGSIAQMLPQASYGLLRPHLERALLGTHEDFEDVIVYPDGTKRRVHAIYVPDVGPDGDVRGISTMAEDITESRAMEEQLRQSQKMHALGTLAGGIAHDLNNILAPILGYTELMQETIAPESEEHEFLMTIISSAHRAKDLVAQILLYSRRGQAAKRVSDVGAIAREVVKLVRLNQPKGIAIEAHIADDLMSISCDPSQVHRLLLNMMVNATQAVGDGGHVTLSVDSVTLEGLESFTGKRLTGHYVRMAISDDGVGMDEETRAQIFDPFFSTKEPGSGTGLGLSTSFGVVQDHNGGICVQSRPGHGSTFEVFLPADKRAPDAAPAAEPLPRGNETLLFVDDEEPIVALYKRVLQRRGYAVVGATDCAEALRLFKATPQRFALVVTDQSMPVMNGVQLSAEIRELRVDVPVILCTGFSESLTPERTHEMGIDALLYKPVAPEEMCRIVRSTLDKAARLRARPSASP